MIYQNLPVNRIHYGVNVVEQKLLHEIQQLKASKVLIVTTNSIIKTNPYKNLIHLLHENHVETYETILKQHVPGNVLMQNIQDITRFNPDLIISCGGGSPIDAGKILSFILAENIQSEEDIYPYSVNVAEKTLNMSHFVPHITIPTTLSAAEFTSIAGITNSKNRAKYKFSHLNMTPSFVFLDPVFTKDTPDWLWTSTGMRAVDHAVETLYSPFPNPVNTGLALQALKKLYKYLPLSKNNPSQLEYRLECQMGAWLSLFSVVNIKLGLSHSIGHQLGSTYDIPHGMTSAIMLPHVMTFLLPRTYEEQARIPEALGKTDQNKSVKEKAEMSPDLIKNLILELDIPHQLRDFNVTKESLPEVVHHILMDIQGEENTVVLETTDLNKEIFSLLEKAW
ncbi:alcohol dehydrogenase [Alteribacillus persepolensis]|uniref:Alcohol dehydrogenase n=1 Tax=Alteribacillus persepolensis TaxID=568899 RepID=A0A1G8HT60_9BACI|nr:iron-containing alcohol dehydrogenase [Alteribacillus persepolensis]SDI09845.1 alcohol dehydrogenase [Alteribacillus persepolensis]